MRFRGLVINPGGHFDGKIVEDSSPEITVYSNSCESEPLLFSNDPVLKDIRLDSIVLKIERFYFQSDFGVDIQYFWIPIDKDRKWVLEQLVNRYVN